MVAVEVVQARIVAVEVVLVRRRSRTGSVGVVVVCESWAEGTREEVLD
jgi:hypothetical protein